MSELALKTVTVKGVDAFDFLQNQLTNDLTLLESEAEILAAWCNPKGRVIWFGTLTPIESGYAMSVAAEMAEEIVRRLTVFRFRAKVEFSIDEGASVDAAFLIENGYPFIGESQTEQFTPHMLNLDLLDAVSISKGCYPGQEIVSRTHFRGATKRRMMRFTSAQPVAPGDKVSDGSRDIGEVLNACNSDLLAVVPVKKAAADLFVKQHELVNTPLPYDINNQK